MKNFPQEMSHASGASLALDTTRLLIALKQPKERSAVEQFLHGVDLFLEDEADEGMVPGERVNHTKTRYFVQSRRPLDDGRLAKIEEAGAQLGLDWIGPVYRQAGQRGRRALMTPLPHVALVKLRQRDAGFKLPEGLGAKGAAEPAIQEITEKSRYLNGHHYLQIGNVKEINAYQLRERLRQIPNAPISDFQFETMPLLTPTSIAPNDTLFPQQWDMTRIEAGGPGTTGWDITTGAATTVVCVLDEGCDLTHPDLRFAAPGINLGTMSGDGSPTGNHGTACAGIVAATYNNGTGVTGVAGDARILPVAFDAWTDVEVAAGINYASANGASIISMSFGWNGWNPAIIDPAIQSAFNNDVVMCVATHNYNGPITYPATNPLVIAVGASDEIDNRKTPASPDGEPWGSNFGPQISVVSPGVHIPTTDRQGAAGYNATDYDLVFNGTSSATPHVAGLAALIRSVYPMLDNVQVRAHIERTAQKVGAVAYADTAGKANGSWNQEMGYGRINVFRALDEADVMIKDAPRRQRHGALHGREFLGLLRHRRAHQRRQCLRAQRPAAIEECGARPGQLHLCARHQQWRARCTQCLGQHPHYAVCRPAIRLPARLDPGRRHARQPHRHHHQLRQRAGRRHRHGQVPHRSDANGGPVRLAGQPPLAPLPAGRRQLRQRLCLRHGTADRRPDQRPPQQPRTAQPVGD